MSIIGYLDDGDDRSHDASQVDDVSSQEGGTASLLTKDESDLYNPSHNSVSSTSSDQEEGDSLLYCCSSISAKNFNAMFLALKQKRNLSSEAVDSVLRLIFFCNLFIFLILLQTRYNT